MENLVLFYPQGHQAHFENGHPERPERVDIVRRALDNAGWWGSFSQAKPLSLSGEFLQTVHDSRYLELLEDACRKGINLDLDTFTTPASWQLALNAAGGTAAVAEAVWKAGENNLKSEKLRGFSLSRPPGHHAGRERGMGFCLLNNIAIAAQYLISYPMAEIENAKRMAIVDFDLHHGNGTQDIFWRRNDVLFISTHQSPLYPGTGLLEEKGAGVGLGYTVNLPFPPATGDSGYRAAMEEVILPMLDRFQPEMILVSLGFDAHWRDPLGHLMLTGAGYGSLIKYLVDWSDMNCRSRIALVMEGGYESLSVAACALASVAALLGEPYHDPIGPPPRPEGKSWRAVIERAKETWRL